jgi:putative ABC transport system permease protein
VAKSWAFYKSFLDSVRVLPGVRDAAISSGIPLGAGNYTTTPTAPVGQSTMSAGQAMPVDWRTISPGYFRTMGIPLLRGRDFTEQDTPDRLLVTVISQTTAQKFWGTDDPLGRNIRLGGNRQFTVIGVVGDVRNAALSQAPAPAMYFAATVRQWPLMDVVVRTEGDPAKALPAIRQRLSELDREMPMSNVRTMDDWVSNNAAQPRLNTVLLEVFAGVALLIAAIGIYGVLSYAVNQRTQEIGVRMALGAQRRDVLALVIREGMTMAMAGIGAGLIGAVGVSRALASLLFGMQARDPATFAVVAAILTVVAVAACCVPAWRATRVDPVVALRNE